MSQKIRADDNRTAEEILASIEAKLFGARQAAYLVA